MKNLLFVFLFILFQGCAAVGKFTKEVKKSGLRIDEKRFPYINWRLPHDSEVRVINGIYDGDTVVADRIGTSDEASGSNGEVIRFLGVDTPELAHPEQGFTTDEPGAVEATEFTKKAVNWKKVILVDDPGNKQGVFGRTLGLIFYRDKKGTVRCLNWELLKRGLAKANLWAQDLLCVKEEWRVMAKIAKLGNPSAYIRMGRESLRESFVDDALGYYRRGLKKYPASADIRKDLAVLYDKLSSLESDKSKRAAYANLARFHWKKLKGTKYDSLARRKLEK